MTSLATTPGASLRRTPLLPICLVMAIAVLLTLHRLEHRLPVSLWWQALLAPDPADMRQLLVHYSEMPRIAVTWLCGAALGIAGVATQQVLRNPLAEPMTLGVFPGAYLALSLASVYAPGLLGSGRDGVALAGGAAALAIVFLLAARRGISPLALILGGMIVNLCCGALSLALAISHYDLLSGLMIWGGGSFVQQDWHIALALLARLLPCAVCLLLCVRPLTVFDAGDTIAGSLGVSLRATRGVALGLTLLITAFVVSAVGVIGFIGLAAPALARLSGARRLRDRMLWAPCFGAALLWLADQLTQQISSLYGTTIPTGAVTTLLGAPLLLMLLRRLKGRPDIASASALQSGTLSPRATRVTMVGSVTLLLLLTGVSLSVGRDLTGWHLDSPDEIAGLLFLRLPHVVAAAGIGALLALAGGIIQRMTGNPMASPDLLGIAAGGAFGLTAALFLTAHPTLPIYLVWCACGSLITLGGLIVFARSSSYAPDALVLAGVTISAVFQAVSTLAMASDDPRVIVLYNLLAGSTYNVSATSAGIVATLALAALAIIPFCRRWLDILPLGGAVSSGLGVNVTVARFALLVLSALLTAAATLVIGPLSFIGLMAPHMTCLLGVRRPMPLLCISAAIGAALMVASDWLGRWVLFPQEIPAGVMATLIGGAYLIVAMFMRGVRQQPAS